MPTLVFAVLLVAGVAALIAIGYGSWRESHEMRRLREARQQALQANERVRSGLKTMATVVPELGGSQLALSERAMDLLDSQSSLLMELRRVRRRTAFSRPRQRRLMAEQMREIAGLDRVFEEFQQAVLLAVCEHAAEAVVMPPVSVSKYRAAFTVLEHSLPHMLWPAMNAILAQHVQLWIRDAAGTWKQARRTGFRWGRELVFSRKNLEDATELRLIVANKVVSEFTVEHE